MAVDGQKLQPVLALDAAVWSQPQDPLPKGYLLWAKQPWRCLGHGS